MPGADTSTPAAAARRRAAVTLEPARPICPMERSICSSASARRTRRAYPRPCGRGTEISNIVLYLDHDSGGTQWDGSTTAVAVVTGGGDGIGAGISRRFAEEGARVVIAEMNEERGRATADELASTTGTETLFVRTDVRRKEDNVEMIARAVDVWGTVDILVNNAWGGGKISRVELKTDELIEHGLAVGFRGPLWAMQTAFPIMKRQGYGRVINICSLNGVNAHMGTVEYNSAKEALRSATRTAAREWAGTGIVCNVICPAAKSASFREVMAEHPELIAAADASNPMGYIGDVYEDIAPVALFLASDDCRYVTGNTLFVDGGSHINGSAWAPDLPDEP